MVDALDGLEQQLGKARKKVDVSDVSFSVREIVRMYTDNELIISPSYQRKYRWPADVASRFIESLFLGLPIPPVFVATNEDFTWEVVDGLQRISTLILFLSDSAEIRSRISGENNAPLKLTGLDELTQLNGATYASLPRPIQLYLARQPLQVISLTDKSDKDVRFDLFSRLNTGAISLTAQEVRTAVYGGKFIDFIERLSQNEDLMSLLKLQKANQRDGTAEEQVLKFFAYKNRADQFRGSVTDFLNNYTNGVSIQKEGYDFIYPLEERVFTETMEFLADTIGGPFIRSRTHVTPLVQFEAVTVAVGSLIQEGRTPSTPPDGWIDDTALVSASIGGTNTRSKLTRRIERAKELFSESIQDE